MSLSKNQRRYLKATIAKNGYVRELPTVKQTEFLVNKKREVLYGGAARGGKTSALLMASLQYVEVPNYNALILRRTFADLALPDAVMERARAWLMNTDAVWSAQDKRWTFPSGATLTFGYLDSEADKYRYQGAKFQFIGFDELTQFTESQYTYLFSRLDRAEGSRTPLRMRAATNPGGVGHDWVKARFISPSPQSMVENERVFIPARLTDNPHIDQKEYAENLNRLDPVTRRQLLEGDWDVSLKGGIFDRDKIRIMEPPITNYRLVRYWDCAATKANDSNDPDYTVGLKLGVHNGIYYVLDIQRMRESPGTVEKRIREAALADGPGVPIVMEMEGGSSGKAIIDHYARNVLVGFDFRGEHPTGSKVERSKPVSAAVYNGNLVVSPRTWAEDFIHELVAFPNGSHDDQVDALSGAFNALNFQYSESSRFDAVGYGGY